MGKILVIDDERPIRRTLCEILEFENFKVDQAEDGEQGLKMATENEYDVILCDIKMRVICSSIIHCRNNKFAKQIIKLIATARILYSLISAIDFV